MKVARWLVVSGIVMAILFGLTTPAAAGPTSFNRDTIILTGTVRVAEGDAFDTVIVFEGPAIIDGTVNNVIALNGDVTVNGIVRETVFAPNGRAWVEHTGIVEGAVYSRLDPILASGGRVDGEMGIFDPRLLRLPSELVTRFAFWLAVSVSTLVLGGMVLLLGPRVADRALSIAKTATGEAIGMGLLVFFGLPIFALIAMGTLVGLPLGFGLLAAMSLIYAIGYVIAAVLLGNLVVPETGSRAAAFLAGWAILRIVALVPVVGGLVWFAATIFGLGVVMVEAWKARGPALLGTPAPIAS